MSFFYQIKKHKSRAIKTGLIGFMYFGLGLFIAIFGPSLLDLQLLANTTIERTAILLPMRSFGYSVGSIIVGLLGDKINHQIVLMISIFFAVITAFCFPLFPSITIMYAIIMVGGIANGSIDTMGSVFIMWLWGEENPAFMQLCAFMFGAGASITPILVRPFLVFNPEIKSIDNSTFNLSISDTKPEIKFEDIKIKWPFIIIGIYYLIVLCAFVFVYFLYPDNSAHPSRNEDDTDKDNESNGKKDKFYLKKPIHGRLKTFVIIIITLAFHSYVCLEILFGSFLTSFVVKSSDLNMTKSDGSLLTSIYWSMYTLFRVVTLIGIIYLPPRSILIANFSLIMFSNLILVPFGSKYQWAIWLGSALIGAGCSSVFGVLFSFLEQLTRVTARMASIFMVASCLGDFILPGIVSSNIDEKPEVFLWVVLIYSLIFSICVLILIKIQNNLLKNQKKNDNKIKYELRTTEIK